jgi:hypothetical protein
MKIEKMEGFYTSEILITSVKAWETGKPDSKVVTIPKAVRERLGDPDLFIVKLDEKGRIIYEPVK